MSGNAFNLGKATAGVYVHTMTSDDVVILRHQYMADTAADFLTISGNRPRGVLIQCGLVAEITATALDNGALINFANASPGTGGDGLILFPGDSINCDNEQAVTGFRWKNAVNGTNCTLRFLFTG